MPDRCFLALAVGDATLSCLRAVRDALVTAAPAWAGEKWVAPELQHVTVKFIGPLPDEAVEDAIECLGAAVAGIGPILLTPAHVKPVPSARRATMLWATLAGDLAAASELHERVDGLLATRFGVLADDRPFNPHLTLVRSRSPRRIHAGALGSGEAVLQECVKDPVRFVSVPSLTLVASTLGRGGPAYRTIAEIPLIKATRPSVD